MERNSLESASPAGGCREVVGRCWQINQLSRELTGSACARRLTTQDWDTLAKFGFPIYLYELSSLQMRRLSKNVPNQAKALKPEAREANAASSSDDHDVDAKLWDSFPLPSVADLSEQ